MYVNDLFLRYHRHDRGAQLAGAAGSMVGDRSAWSSWALTSWVWPPCSGSRQARVRPAQLDREVHVAGKGPPLPIPALTRTGPMARTAPPSYRWPMSPVSVPKTGLTGARTPDLVRLPVLSVRPARLAVFQPVFDQRARDPPHCASWPSNGLNRAAKITSESIGLQPARDLLRLRACTRAAPAPGRTPPGA